MPRNKPKPNNTKTSSSKTTPQGKTFNTPKNPATASFRGIRDLSPKNTKTPTKK